MSTGLSILRSLVPVLIGAVGLSGGLSTSPGRTACSEPGQSLAKTGDTSCQSCASSLIHLPAFRSEIEAATSAIADHSSMVLIPGGTFTMGIDGGASFEGPAHRVSVAAFWMDRHSVTVAEFGQFIAATGYKTDADQWGWSGVFDVDAKGWTRVDGANWQHPEGPSSTPQSNEPVTQVSYNDAIAYAQWAGKRLPTEAEFEYAARGGLVGNTYAWGNKLRPDGKPVANWWQGDFPSHNTGEDGFVGRAPVESFPPNGYGLYDMAGNVWQWCADWYGAHYYDDSPSADPKGPEIGKERALRGGSFLCAENFCTNYRVVGRSHNTPDSALNNLGFRCVQDADLALKQQKGKR